eukprot:Skav222057  [mRNA]  locus=scaffold707:9847:14953:- [translate_table: standard]
MVPTCSHWILPFQGWKAFYDANNGAIPIECQAGRAAMGMAAEETRLVRIGEEGEDGGWNELVDAAAMALDQLGKSHATNWANQMKKAAPVLDKLARMQLVDLQVSRDWVRQHLPQLGSSEDSMMVLDHKDIRDQRSSNMAQESR